MKARAWKWVILSALTLMVLDIAGLTLVAPHARELLAGPRARAVVHAGALALRNIELASLEAGAGWLGGSSCPRHRTIVLERISADGKTCTMNARCLRMEVRKAVIEATEARHELEVVPAIVETPAAPAAPAAPSCPACPRCPKGSCPASGSRQVQVPGSGTVGLPLSRFMTTIE